LESIYQEVLYPYQREASQRIEKQRKILLADQPGLGKTLEVLASFELADLYNPNDSHAILILTPVVNARTAWIDTIERFVMPRYPTVRVIDLSSGSSAKKQATLSLALEDEGTQPIIVVANHDALAHTKKGAKIPALQDPYWSAIAIDESHLVLPVVKPNVITNFWRGLSKLKVHDNATAFKIAISGTPDRGKLEYRYGTMKFMAPSHLPSSHWKWIEDKFNVYDQKISRTRTVKKIGTLKRPYDWAQLDKDLMIRRTKEEVLPELPPKSYHFIELPLTKAHREAYRKAQAEAMNDESPTSLLVFSTIARQLATYAGEESSKLDWLLEWMAERGYMEDLGLNGKVVLASQYVKTLKWFQRKLAEHNVHAELLTGDLSATQRENVQRRFQDPNDPLRVVLLSGSMGVGITLDTADDLIMIDLPYDPDKLEQIEDRVHRASNMHKVSIWHLLSRATIDTAIAEVSTTRRLTTRSLLDGARGVDFSRKVVQHLTGRLEETPLGDNKTD
jgi:SNF2 family DNA or RNA helicase